MEVWYGVIILINVLYFVLCNEVSSNIILILTDDQDVSLGGITPMGKTQRLIGLQGVNYTNAFVTTPICCPSRSSILTGLYQHNHKTVNNSLSGGCSSTEWQRNYENRTFAVSLKSAGYTTFYAGKYLNMYGSPSVGGTAHVPLGWDWWLGLVGNSRYYNYTLSVNGTAKKFSDQYLTSVIKEYAVQFLQTRHALKEKFLMVLATPAPHAPFTPEPKYKDYFKNVKAMKTPNFNIPINKDKHWLLRMKPSPLPESFISILDQIYSQRWETLLSVDDLVETIVTELDRMRILNNTFIIFTSDNGFHVGQFGMPWDKRQPYEFDLRVPLLVRGPNLPQNKTQTKPVLNIDLAPTILRMAGITPYDMDGISFFPINNLANDSQTLRDYFLVEYRGEGNKNTVSDMCHLSYVDTVSECSPDSLCKCQDSVNNTYNCIRFLNADQDLQFCKFRDEEEFMEVYNLRDDPYQLYNLAEFLEESNQSLLTQILSDMMKCSGHACNSAINDLYYMSYKYFFLLNMMVLHFLLRSVIFSI